MLHPARTTASRPDAEPESGPSELHGHRTVTRRPARLTALCLCALLIFLLAACGPRGNGGSQADTAGGAQSAGTAGTIDIVMVIEPLRVGTATVTAQVSDGAGPLVGADVSVRGDMTHAGMPPALGDLQEAQPGAYATDAFELPMAGDWIITIEVAAADGRKATSESFVSVAAR
ncbi:MAG TPA: FixH family protein [Trueperaceae bacterium]|nr:FixH family protein [Trueperaceae bacterium]